ncbi:MAG: hypothetical protein IJM34_10365 [Lachnospiraceae bacterium]|nr:hypothetical protein [Lachnospiraceae bacterium]
MYSYRYTNPNTTLYQAEYTMYQAVSKLFAKVSCRSLTLERLKLYHAELSEKGKQELDKKIRLLVDKYVADKVCFPAMNVCHAEVRILNNADGTHRFLFSDGVYGFLVSIKHAKGGKIMLSIEERNKTGLKPPEKTEIVTVNAQRCA